MKDQRKIMADVLKDIPTKTIGWYLTIKDDYQIPHFRTEDRDSIIELAAIWCELDNVSDDIFINNANDFLDKLNFELQYGLMKERKHSKADLINLLYAYYKDYHIDLYNNTYSGFDEDNCITNYFLNNHRTELQKLIIIKEDHQLLLGSDDPELIVLGMGLIFERLKIKPVTIK